MTHEGDCFAVTAGFVAAGVIEAISQANGLPVVYNEKSPFRIVHGLPLGNGGDVLGKRYWHAWIEMNTARYGYVVLERSNGKKRDVLRDEYYAAAQLDEEHVWRFTPAEAKKLFRRHRHCGPWVPGWEHMEDPSLSTTPTKVV